MCLYVSVLNIVELSDKYSFQNIDASEGETQKGEEREGKERESTRGFFLC